LITIAWFGLLAACTGPVEPTESVHEDDHEEGGRLALSAEAYAAAGIAVAPVGLGTLTPTVRVTGTLSYDERRMAIASARIGGRITEVVADYGQRVSRGDVLAWIDSPELGAAQVDYLRAESMQRLREAEYERARLLVEGEAISRGELLRREADWRAAQAELQTARHKLVILGLTDVDIGDLLNEEVRAGRVYPVRASIPGRVTERRAIAGRVVSADDELFTIAELDTVWLFLQVFEKDLHSVREGAAVMLTCESHPEDRFRGTIDFVGEVLDPHSRTVQARAIIDNPERELKPGMFVYATIEAKRPGGAPRSVLLVPVAALASIDGQRVAFVQTADREFESREVEVGEATGDWIEVRSGLTEGETIAVSGLFVLKSELLKGGLEGHHH
jgi:cobalt-zinc-cadmium efflux system membrane fusion protein